MKKAKDSKEYDTMLFEYIEKELGLSVPKKKAVSKKERTHKNKESKVLNEKR